MECGAPAPLFFRQPKPRGEISNEVETGTASQSGTGVPHSKTLSRHRTPKDRQVMECGAPERLLHDGIEVIINPHLINLKAIDAFDLGWGRGPLKPCG